MNTRNIREPGPARPLTDDEIERMTAAASPRDRALVWLALSAGLRIGEACSLLVGHIGSDQSVLIEAHNAKSRKSRRIYVSDRGWQELLRWLEHRPSDPAAPVFPSRKGGGCMHRGHGSRLVQALMQSAGVLGASSHSMRRTHAHGLRREAVGLEIIQRQLGHSNLTITQRYLADFPEGHREAVAALKLGRTG